MAALVNGTKGIDIRNGSRLVEPAERSYYRLPKGSCEVIKAGEGWTGLPCGANCLLVSSCFPSFWAKEAIRGTSPGMLEAKEAAELSLPVNASLQTHLFLWALAACYYLSGRLWSWTAWVQTWIPPLQLCDHG